MFLLEGVIKIKQQGVRGPHAKKIMAVLGLFGQILVLEADERILPAPSPPAPSRSAPRPSRHRGHPGTEAIPAPSALTSRQDVKSSSHVVMWLHKLNRSIKWHKILMKSWII